MSRQNNVVLVAISMASAFDAPLPLHKLLLATYTIDLSPNNSTIEKQKTRFDPTVTDGDVHARFFQCLVHSLVMGLFTYVLLHRRVTTASA